MSNLTNRVVAYTATRPHLITVALAMFASLFAGYCWVDLITGNIGGARLAAICAGLALAAAVYDTVRLVRKRIAAGQVP